jgi:hypothetical protein
MSIKIKQMIIKTPIYFCIIIVLICSLNKVLAQTFDFSGTWIFQSQESLSGKLYGNGSPKQIKLSTMKNAIIIESITAGATADDDLNVTVPLDGKPMETVKNGKLKTVTSIKNFNGKSFTETTAYYFVSDLTKVVYKNTDGISLEDGKLILDRKSENFTNSETWESKATYEKQ